MIFSIILALSVVINLVLVVAIWIVIQDYMKLANSLDRLYKSELYEKKRLQEELADLMRGKRGRKGSNPSNV